MNTKIKNFIALEQQQYDEAFSNKNYEKAFSHLERIHIVSQPFAIAHTISHLRMLKFAILTFRPFEILVQIIYTLLGGLLSLIGLVPLGNTGGANAISKGNMEIPNDIQTII
ncbi:MAG: DUF3703 domain-containing protein [Chitinophagaceae bacterium]|nr:DUF3703 domain-containing protein [Chitinophagaceae bacterium]